MLDNPHANVTCSIWHGPESKALLDENLKDFLSDLRMLTQAGVQVTQEDGTIVTHPVIPFIVCDLSLLIKILSMTNWNSKWCCFKCLTEQ